MKKFLAIAASAVMAFGVVPFAACGGNEEESAANLNYTEVDVSTEQKKSAFIEEVTTKIKPDTMFGDTTTDNYSLGFAYGMSCGFDVSATYGEMAFSAKMDSVVDTKMKISEVSMLAESTSSVKLNTELPEGFFEMVGMEAEIAAMIDALISNFDCTIKEYIDGEYVYAELPQSYLDALPAEVAGMFPESGKIKISLSDMGSSETPVIEGYAAAAEDNQTAVMVAGVMEMLINYNVKIETSTESGYAIKLTAGKDAILNIIGDMTGETSIATMVDTFATFNACELTAYLAVDKDGMFKEVGISLNLDVEINIPANVIEEGAPAISAQAKANIDMSVKTFNGNITLPSDLDSYVDLMEMMG